MRRSDPIIDEGRRRFLRWLAASPLLASSGGLGALAHAIRADAPRPLFDALVERAEDALDVFDLQRVAEARVPTAHYGYIMTGVDGEETHANNRAALDRIDLRARRLVDVSRIDMRTTLFGREWETPLVIAPCGSQRAFHPDGELATARAAAARGHLQVLSTVSSTAVEEVNAARGEPVWFQLYAPPDWTRTRALVQLSRDAGCPVLVITVDLKGGSNRLTLERYKRLDDRDCGACHLSGGAADPVKPMYRGLPAATTDGFIPAGMSWEFVARLRDLTDQKIVIKGLVTGEDAALARRYGVDGVWVSNHGGRAEGDGRATIDALPEVVEALSGALPVIVDSGFRRGTDLFKGIARGATAVAIGRPYLWGLGAFGQAGVEQALAILRRELAITMGAAGTPSLASIGPSALSHR
ncbi:MAG: alpha-hydroxy acid oxidase [Pseudomonadales bacterium]|jgi:isopentenyl diphosphate isomerase/L-lactate dehydrogenase-like FMN-dependent dehydrogenase|nr:alpha-hydroxy acid oxidase [Pseudomonadales bacterium]